MAALPAFKVSAVLALALILSPVASLRLSMKLSPRRAFIRDLGALGGVVGAAGLAPRPAFADLPQGRSVPLDQRDKVRGPPGVNKPELLPSGPKRGIIDLEKMLTSGQVTRLEGKLAKLEEETGVKIRVLTQAYPNTPGLAIKDYWGVDGKTVVMVVDRGSYRGESGATPNILNFNVGGDVDLMLPPVFFTRTRNLFGSNRFVKDEGEDRAIQSAVDAISYCLREEGGCSDVPPEFRPGDGIKAPNFINNKSGIFEGV
eukprot:CAMPEP_0172589726 /NCGR_PEP_ID=MMETSP1068-20121228/8343_1 /TAXON_ID=35684 /ORGANISM="Pseudopedinella elastica, Strain CCMP716" /LENGTH=257 /DNA_ID=CAMNT_0013385371 /DNA_START=22 /DNA_END=795 /DNA_ORIENTATION=-